MSLLLDALKKAANDKEKSSRDEAAGKQIIPPPQAEATENSKAATEKPVLQPVGTRKPAGQSAAHQLSIHEQSSSDKARDEETLTLEIEQDDNDELSLPEAGISSEPVEKNEFVENNDADNVKKTHTAASKLTVSDDALSLLIDKTNRDEKQRKVIVTVSVIFLSLLTLLIGGMYYYTDMQAEIADIERKHQIALQQMRVKTNREKTPEKSEIIRNLVSDAKLEEKVEYAKAQIASEKKSVTKHRQEPLPQVTDKVVRADLTITRTRKSDPVGESLDAAWLAYENGRYDEAGQLYKDVLRIEGDNRDAQLGLGAIAIIEKDSSRARRIYLSLLQQDPRDPIATAALAELNSDKASLTSDNDYLLSLLEKNPDAPHLNFSVGNNYAQQKKWKSAQKYYFRAWQHDSENADYLFNLAVSLDQLGKPQQALNFYRESIEKSKNKQVSFSIVAVQNRIDELGGS